MNVECVFCFMFCIVFHVCTSQSLSTLTVIEDFLSKRPMPASRIKPDSSTQNWVRHINYYRKIYWTARQFTLILILCESCLSILDTVQIVFFTEFGKTNMLLVLLYELSVKGVISSSVLRLEL